MADDNKIDNNSMVNWLRSYFNRAKPETIKRLATRMGVTVTNARGKSKLLELALKNKKLIAFFLYEVLVATLTGGEDENESDNETAMRHLEDLSGDPEVAQLIQLLMAERNKSPSQGSDDEEEDIDMTREDYQKGDVVSTEVVTTKEVIDYLSMQKKLAPAFQTLDDACRVMGGYERLKAVRDALLMDNDVWIAYVTLLRANRR